MVKKDTLELKKRAAERAVEFIESGMIVGLGHGSTADFAVQRIAELLKRGELSNVIGVPCSTQVEHKARRLDIRLTTFEEHTVIDLTIDGADEVDPNMDLVKGGGGALLREKIVAQASRREIIVVDESKLSPALGTRRAVPVEVIPFGWQTQVLYLESLGATVKLRKDDNEKSFMTDQGNLILDSNFGPISNPESLAEALNARTGIVEHGLFLGLATDLIVANTEGVYHRTRNKRC
ncbi:MAG TPA: ribose-5-phosphate isomerase RpiA [Desulfatiglandales bacterium]|nr:ribose-5-phosphate isomerase RpiA [Desulfatiglandales bacterium]